jgi:membrane protein implicated in regulation of membrane protease activity
MMLLSSTEIWLLIGIILIILEFTQLPGIGFLFLGFGAISASVITNYWQNETELVQFAYFGISSLLWFILLWYPMKAFLSKDKNKLSRDTFDIIGSQVIVENKDIKANELGQVSWCGTILNAKLIGRSNRDIAKIGDTLIIIEVKGNVLFCNKMED